jgi:hypothetical protein
VPESPVVDAGACPSSLREDSSIGQPVAAAVEAVLDVDLSIEFDDPDGLEAYLERLP